MCLSFLYYKKNRIGYQSLKNFNGYRLMDRESVCRYNKNMLNYIH